MKCIVSDSLEWVPRHRRQALRLGFLLGKVSLDECIVQTERRLKEKF